MRKQNQAHHQNQAEHQIQAQAQVQQQTQQHQTQAQTLEGGVVAMKEPQNRLYFVTFATKLDPETARQILVELRRRFPSMRPIFIPSPPPGRRRFVTINGILTILTFPHTKQEQIYNQNSTGFTLKELAKIKKT